MNSAEELRRVAEIRGWKAILFDVDDTLIPSAIDIWNPAFEFFSRNFAGLCNQDEQAVLVRLREINNWEYRNGAGVHPSKYHTVASRMAEEYGVDEVIPKQLMKEVTKMIYLATPPLLPEAEKAIETVSQAGLAEAFVTHSPKGRATRLVKAWGMEGKIPVFTESTLKEKGKEVWLRAIAGLGLTGSQTVAVDDKLISLEGAREAGITDRVWIKPVWAEFAAGNDEGVIKIEHIGELVEALIANFRQGE